jgi:imidazolonepropionase
MTAVVLENIGELVTNEDQGLGVRTNVSVVMDAGVVAWIGAEAPAADVRIDCAGASVVPGFVDSHAHLVFAGDRAAEFDARMAGVPYNAGGIKTTVAATRAASDDHLRWNAQRLAAELQRSGTTTFEIKSGYGLTVADETRAVRIARELTEEVTFLGAHVVPQEWQADRRGYVDLVKGAMLQSCAPHSRWIDVFCERGAFDEQEAREILQAGVAEGLTPRVHANQLGHGPGVRVAVEAQAASADHCTHLSDDDIDLLADSATVATLLPGAEFGTRSPYPDARRLLDAGVDVALATDCNPGTSFTTSMPLIIALAVREMNMTVAQALYAATAGGAMALRRSDVGRICVGGPADLVLLDAPTYLHLAYRPGVALVRRVWIQGVEVSGASRLGR